MTKGSVEDYSEVISINTHSHVKERLESAFNGKCSENNILHITIDFESHAYLRNANPNGSNIILLEVRVCFRYYMPIFR
jgi:hypothetical protein